VVSSSTGMAKLSIITVFVLIVIKAVASVLTGSLSIRADAIHSAIDLVGVIIGYIGIKIAGKPADEKHAFGHGKAENLAGIVIGGLIFIAAITIFYESVKRLISGGTIEMVTIGIYITAAAIVINGVMSFLALRVARKDESVALEASARDMLADVISSVAVLVGLILVKVTGLVILDSIVALAVSIIIGRTAFLTVKRSLDDLLDTRLPESEEKIILETITSHCKEIAGYHKLRTRRSGGERYIDLHLLLPRNMKLEDSHNICDLIESELKETLRNPSITIHVEPCDEECEECKAECARKKKRL